jgi:hypothetical protein
VKHGVLAVLLLLGFPVNAKENITENAYALYITEQGVRGGLIAYFVSRYDFNARRNCMITKDHYEDLQNRSFTCMKI